MTDESHSSPDDRDRDDARGLRERIREVADETTANAPEPKNRVSAALDGVNDETPSIRENIDHIVSGLSPTARKHLAEAEKAVARERENGALDGYEDREPGELTPAERRMLDALTGAPGIRDRDRKQGGRP